MIKFKEISFSYNDDPFISNLNLNIEEGKFITILGKNGSGKSTLLKLLFGIENLKFGDIIVNKLSLKNNPYEVRKIMGLVFQNPDEQIVSDSIEEELAFSMENYGYDEEKIRESMNEVLNLVGLSHKLKSKIHTLSGGEKQRLCIASAMVLNPKVLVLDEATSMLDTNNRENIMKILSGINKKGVTIIMVTHHLLELKYSEDVIYIEKGEVVFQGEKTSFIRDLILNSNKFSLNLPTSFKLISEIYQRKGIDLSEFVFDIKKVGEKYGSIFR